MNNLTIAVDFDGTVVKHQYPFIGEDVPHAERVLKRLVTVGQVDLILFTMRSNEELLRAVEWYESKSIPLWGVQANPTQSQWTSSPKAYANYYIDDAAVGCPLIHSSLDRPYVDWVAVERFFVREGILYHE